MHKKDIDFRAVTDDQILNHYNNNSCLTAKSRLGDTLKNLIWFNNIDIDMFLPKCYHLNSQAEYFDFIEEFKVNKAESILKRFVNKVDKGKIIDHAFMIKIQIAVLAC